MSNSDMLVQILKIVNDLKEDVKENRREIQKSREIEEAHWQENLRRWKENDKKWEENDRRWKENDKRWEENKKLWQENNKQWEENKKLWQENNKQWEENKKLWQENHKRWEEYKKNREIDRNDILSILTSYDISISEQLGDKNAKKMKQII